ncbi:hypothetical protein MPSEU_000509500 [Mayamaea pseudoterrestris]|nr:hypothetical protein MPSEU_000509500 [Mayamaea pseudoterrestris]
MAADDISAAFRWLHYHPDIAVAFGTVLSHWLVIPVGMIFGGRFSPGWYMILGELRGHIAATLDIGNASTDLSENITLGAELDAAGKSSIVSAVQDRYNNGSRAILGQDYKFGFSSFVDDQAVVTTRPFIREAIHRSVIAARVVFGEPNPKHRSPCINERKWKSEVTHQLTYLGLDWDTRAMTVGWPEAKQQKLASMLEHLHSDWLSNKQFKTVVVTAADKSSIVGLMRHGAFVADLADFLSIRVQQSLSDAARKADEQARRVAAKARTSKPSSRAWWRKGRIALSKEVLDDLRMLYPTLNNPAWRHVWHKPIGLMVDREPNNSMRSDASTKGVGGWNLTLLFMWRLNDEDLATCKFKMRKFNPKPSRRPLVTDEYHINILEFVAIVINVVLSLGAICHTPAIRDRQHILNVLSDNTSALSWMRHAARCKSHSREGQCGGRPTLSIHSINNVVGVRYLAGHAGIGSLQNLPSGARAAFNDLVRDQWERKRGDIRTRNDRAFDQRASHFGRWSLQAGFTDKSFEEVSPGQEVAILAGYLFAVASGKTSLEIDKKKLQGKAGDQQNPLMVKTLVGYLNAAHSLLELFLNRKFPIQNPSKEGYHPMLADILASRRKWQKAREKREPFTNKMFEYLYATLKKETATDATVNLDVQAAVFDWTCLGAFTGSRANEYAQTTARRGCFSKVPANRDAGEWANQPLAFIDLDFMFYTADSVLITHDRLLRQQRSATELHLRFRYDKSQTNFTIRKFKRSGHPFICPIAASISIIGRARCLHNKPFKEPLGVFRTSSTGVYDYLQSRDIIKVMRAAVVGAYPNPQHFLRQNVTRIVAHSNRVTAAVALQNAGLDIQEIAFRLRWSAPSVQHYLRESSQEVGRLTLKAIQGAVLI